jgi:alpha-glucosidase
LSGASWIKPGRSVWQWWSSGGPKFSEQSQWLDWTRRTGFEYYLVDEGWKNWRHGDDDAWTCLSKVCAEAKEKGVGIWIWMHSRDVPDRASLAAFCQKAAKLGVVGVKIDFIPGAGRDWSNWYVQALREAAASHLMVDFHGATKPSGLERTWPNEMSRESVRGHEYHISRYHRVLPPEHDTILPFTRFVIGHGDYTPTVFEPKELKGHTWARELAQAIVFTSPFLCYADHPKNYLQNPAFDVMKAIPPVWDETVVLPGSEIGKCAALARRSDDRWFVGVINGAEATDVDIPLSFLGKGDYHAMVLTDDESRADGWTRRDQTFAASDHLKLNVQSSGGACAFFEPVGTPKR